MTEILDLSRPKPAPEQQQLILVMSDAFGLSPRCKRALCRRAGACQGFTGEVVPHCLTRLLECFRVCLAATRVLFPDAAPSEPAIKQEFDQQLWRILKRNVDLIERQLDGLEQRTGVKAGREGAG